jgi:hypothetical protein
MARFLHTSITGSPRLGDVDVGQLRKPTVILETAIGMRKNAGDSHMSGLRANLAHSPDW